MIHAITATRAINQAKKREALSRGCPKCRRRQAAGEEKINQPVTCEKCGAEILPRAAAERKATGQAKD